MVTTVTRTYIRDSIGYCSDVNQNSQILLVPIDICEKEMLNVDEVVSEASINLGMYVTNTK
jgi:hypothetical protein